MSYVKTTWADGDVITNQKLNKIETGIENATNSAVPDITYMDNGKVLAVSDSSVRWESLDVVLNTSFQTDGNVLTIDNGSYTWSAPSGGVPPISSSDSGKILLANESAAEWGSFDSKLNLALDVSSGSNGEVLTISNGSLSWESAGGGGSSLPSYSSSDEGKSLKVDSNGDLEWDYVLPSTTSLLSDRVLVGNSSGGPSWSGMPVPEPQSGDEGKVLSVSSGGDSVCWKNFDVFPSGCGASAGDVLTLGSSDGVMEWRSPFPSYDSYDEGKSLKVNSNGDLAWDYVLPSYSSADAGCVLTVDSDGHLVWQMPQ